MSLQAKSQASKDSVFLKDVQSVDAIIRASYEVVSGEKGAKRQWERDRFLHHPNAVYSFTDRQNEKSKQLCFCQI